MSLERADSELIDNDRNNLESVWNLQCEEYESRQLKLLIYQLMKDGLKVKDIIYHLPCSGTYCYKIIKEIDQAVFNYILGES